MTKPRKRPDGFQENKQVASALSSTRLLATLRIWPGIKSFLMLIGKSDLLRLFLSVAALFTNPLV
jgi:hypothetical protein